MDEYTPPSVVKPKVVKRTPAYKLQRIQSILNCVKAGLYKREIDTLKAENKELKDSLEELRIEMNRMRNTQPLQNRDETSSVIRQELRPVLQLLLAKENQIISENEVDVGDSIRVCKDKYELIIWKQPIEAMQLLSAAVFGKATLMTQCYWKRK
ncbi:unnamed protein product [Allacma fusca]|uniref:Uncharacterized protein n=1 Tax=Allacma fusca TaxID=39272 RepID=A0A8J2JUA4_9HEXA|nr:unnamed protein product [Allacma fusca]